MAVCCLTFNLTCELFVATALDWHQVRGAQMILSMKLISLAFDVDDKEEETMKKGKEEGLKSNESKETHCGPLIDGQEVRKRRQRRRLGVPKEEEEVKEAPIEARPAKSGEDEPGVLATLGYAFCPGNCVFGPWSPYEEYAGMLEAPVWVSEKLLTGLTSVHTSMHHSFRRI